MRKVFAALLCCLMFLTTAYAANGVSLVQTNATVSSDGSCQVSISMTLRLDEPASDLTLPLGPDVSSVRLNGSVAGLEHSGGITGVKLGSITKNVTGSVPIQVSFIVNSCVTTDEEGRQTVTVPLLYGFTYPVESMDFTVTMPGVFDTVPTFLSGYHEQDIESSIKSSITGATITGSITSALKDHETLIMTLAAPEGMFPQAQSMGGSLIFDAIAMGVCGALAVIYWMMTMACLPRMPISWSTAPEGITAGNVGSYLARKGADLTMMVITWAQLGYLIIHLDDNGRVMLHKKMEMGNERSSFEAKTFRSLFGKGAMVDATGYRYARLWERTAQASMGLSWGLRKRSGNPRILRLLGCGIGLFAGVAAGDSLATTQAWRITAMLLMGCGGAFGSWHVQEGLKNLQLAERFELAVSLVCAAAMLLAGQISGTLYYMLAAVAGNALIGLLAARTGHRTETGNRTRDEILGLRRHMCRVSRPELLRIMRSNPDYYYELAPYALAMGVDRQFAKRFGSLRLPGCSWLVTSGSGAHNTPAQWSAILRETAGAMNNLQKRPPWEKLLNIR